MSKTGWLYKCKYIPLGLILVFLIPLINFGCATPTTVTSTVPKTITSTVPPPPTTPSVQTGGTLKIAIYADAQNLGWPSAAGNPLAAEVEMREPCLESLAVFDSAANLVPWLAKDFTADSNAKTFTITLRQGVTFQDGTPFNATAVKWNLDKNLATKKSALAGVTSVDVVDDYTVRLNLSTWNNSISQALADTSTGVMISPTTYQNGGSTDAARQDWSLHNPVGTGPFQFVSWTRDVKVVYKKFNGYWQKGKPYLDGVEFDIIADPTVAELSFIKGDVDILWEPTASVTKDIQKQGNYNITTLQNGLLGAIYGIIGDSANSKSPFSNVQVRQALNYALDKASLDGLVNLGLGVVTDQWATPGTWPYNTQINYTYNVDKAKQLLTQAGFGTGFTSNLYYDTSKPQLPILYTAVQSYLSAVGIKVTLQPVDSAKFNTFAVGGWDGLMEWAASMTPDPVAGTGMASRFLTTATGPFAKTTIHNTDIDDLINQALSTTSSSTKQSVTQQLQQVVFQQYAIVTNIFIIPDIVAQRTNVQNSGFGQATKYQWNPADTWLKK
ncbi:MAG: ABC transporter substrate-binding protein [Dehalococcoidia bacterium]